MDRSLTVDNQKLTLTNLEKVYWPEEGYTKLDLIQYYADIAEYILPHLKDRPQSMHRFPNGIQGKSFFHKNVEDLKIEWAQTIEIRSESEDETVRYLLCQNKAMLLYMANLGCIEINPWLSRIQHPGKPDFLVIDLDPLDISFEHVVEVAVTAGEMLQEMGIVSYPKTSGATGIHICLPLGACYTYHQARSFAEILAIELHKRIPATTSLERLPAKRKGKVYIDWLQNGEGKTIAAPYCLRPEPGAPASTPLTWEEVPKVIDPKQFHIKNMKNRLEKIGDIFQPVLGEGIDVGSILRKNSVLAVV